MENTKEVSPKNEHHDESLIELMDEKEDTEETQVGEIEVNQAGIEAETAINGNETKAVKDDRKCMEVEQNSRNQGGSRCTEGEENFVTTDQKKESKSETNLIVSEQDSNQNSVKSLVITSSDAKKDANNGKFLVRSASDVIGGEKQLKRSRRAKNISGVLPNIVSGEETANSNEKGLFIALGHSGHYLI